MRAVMTMLMVRLVRSRLDWYNLMMGVVNRLGFYWRSEVWTSVFIIWDRGMVLFMRGRI